MKTKTSKQYKKELDVIRKGLFSSINSLREKVLKKDGGTYTEGESIQFPHGIVTDEYGDNVIIGISVKEPSLLTDCDHQMDEVDIQDMDDWILVCVMEELEHLLKNSKEITIE